MGVEYDGYNTDKLGMRFTKPRPELAQLHTTSYKEAIDWLKTYLRLHCGLFVNEAQLDIHTSNWHLYGTGRETGDTALLIVVPHELIERVMAALIRKERLPVE